LPAVQAAVGENRDPKANRVFKAKFLARFSREAVAKPFSLLEKNS
jgi:hypothetical protein